MRSWCALLLIVGTAVLGCGAEEPTRTGESAGTASATAETVTIRVRIADGSVTPANAQDEAKVGQPVVLLVSSDSEDELHVHATPEHTFAVSAAPDQRFEFTVQVPGRVEIELHRTHRTVTTLLVRP
ncbi:hypothetical protein [Nocardia transvalensis]|uniref:hypothetical protein n=1 Tax=Nocardia transvalensis TaxID=37333 RepID=UPI00189549E9|nr:hypothetical protein [Nocardia transvalensis]MBF6329434.1 hypothetical protein [Nocardia transvalensis]